MKNFLVVGASGGIGNEISSILSTENKVYGTFKNHEKENTNNISYHFLDVLSEKIDVSFIPDSLDGLVYSPGAIKLKPFHRITPNDFTNDYNLQVLGAIKVIQTVLPSLKKSEYASIVLFSTVAVQQGFNFHSLVSTSKGAIEGLTKSLAAEFAPSIRVNCIAPSLTDTPLADSLLGSEEKRIAAAQRHPLKRFGSAEDIAQMAAYLLSDKSSWITGQVLHVDGGMSTLKT